MITGLSLSGCNKNADKEEPGNGDKTVAVTGVSLNETSKVLTVGENFALTATVAPDNASNKTLTWTSANPAIATVNAGTVNALAAGETVITVKTADGNKTATCTVRVNEAVVIVTGVSLSKSDTAITVGATVALTATVAPENATNKTIGWTNSNPAIATVNAGTVTALAVGETVITVKTADGDKTASCTVRVYESIASEIVMTVAATTSPVSIGLTGHEPAMVDWGDGNKQTITLNKNEQQLEHTYTATSDSHTVTITGTNITGLTCNENQLTALDVSGNTALTELHCRHNKLTALDVSNNTALTHLSCSNNQLTVLDVSKNTALTRLACYSNQLTVLDVSKNTALTYLSCYYNKLTALDVSTNTALTSLDCSSIQLTALDVSTNTALTELRCNNNTLTALDVSTNTALTYLNCSSTQLRALDVSKNTALMYLSCIFNQLTALDVSKNTALIDISCSFNQLTALDVSKNTALKWLYCGENQLTALDVSTNTAIERFYCNNNQLTALDVSKNTALEMLYCNNNQLSADELNNMFGTLHSKTSPYVTKRIWIIGNPGIDGCDKSIATNKGWEFID